MSDGSSKTYEMMWDCEYCGVRKLLGKTHRHCPECGAAQNPEKRYFPQEHEKVAVEDHVFVGADVTCPSCQAPNSASGKFCAVCGSPLDGAGEVNLVADPNASPQPSPSASAPGKKRGKGMLVGILVGSGVLLITVLVLVLVFWTKTVAISVTGHTWQREIQVESFAARSQSEWCNRMPSDAYRVTRKSEVRSHKKIPDGQDCRTVRKDRGDGTYTQQQKCTTKYRKEPVYDQKCYFTVNRWGYARSVSASGRSLAEIPVWPQVNLNGKVKGLGAERQGKHVEKYIVHFADAEGEAPTCDFPEVNWRAFAVGSQWDADANVVTGILDCASLRAPGSG